MYSQVLNTIGLSLDIIGGCLLFAFGPPQPVLDEIKGKPIHFVDRSGIDEENLEIRKRRKIHTKISGISLVIIIVGFILQLIAIYV